MNKWLLYGGMGIAAYAAFSYYKANQAAPATDTGGVYSPLTSFAPMSNGAVSGSGSSSSLDTSISNDALANMLRDKYKGDNQQNIIQAALNAISNLWSSGGNSSLKGSILIGDYPIGFDIAGVPNAYPGNFSIVPPIGQISGTSPVNAVQDTTLATILSWLQSAGNAASSIVSAPVSASPVVAAPVQTPGMIAAYATPPRSGGGNTPGQDIRQALELNIPVSDASWAIYGFGPGGAALNNGAVAGAQSIIAPALISSPSRAAYVAPVTPAPVYVAPVGLQSGATPSPVVTPAAPVYAPYVPTGNELQPPPEVAPYNYSGNYDRSWDY